MTTPTQEILDAVSSASDDGGITCALLRRLAEEMDVPYHVVGKATDDLGIRVRSCDLGCF
jgi:hypothetical protein